MLYRLVSLVLLSSALCWSGETPDVAGQVSQSNYTHYLRDLLFTRAGDSRGPLDIRLAQTRERILNTFESFGLTSSLQAFSWKGATYYNVIGILPGKIRPHEYDVAGAHYDSKDNPGADDDASGVAALLEAARVLSQHDLSSSVVFIAFDQEETGLAGSKAWVEAHASDRIRGMLQLDMIAFNPPGSTHNLLALCPPDASPNPTLTAFQDAVTRHSGGVTPVFGGVSTSSDHAPFARLTSSVQAIEASFYSNTNYHKALDSVDTPNYIDYAFATAVTRSTVGYLATQAGLLDEPEGEIRFRPGGIVNAASYHAGAVAPTQLLTLMGGGLTPGSTVSIRDSSGQERAASLTYTSAHQINLVLPSALAAGRATVTVTRIGGEQVAAGVSVQSVAPGIFTADMNGSGTAAAQAVRVAPDGAQTLQALFACTPICNSQPIDFGGENDRVFLILYGTGVRGRVSLNSVELVVDGAKLPVQYAGAQPVFAGLDQINVELPRTLRGRGAANVLLQIDNVPANLVTVDLGVR